MSIEGYWYWLLAEGQPEREQLRFLWGYRAKRLGKELAGQDWSDDPEFQRKIKLALEAKLREHPKLQTLLRETQDLPIVHYYWYGTAENPAIRTPTRGLWVWEHWTKLRKELA